MLKVVRMDRMIQTHTGGPNNKKGLTNQPSGGATQCSSTDFAGSSTM